MGEKCKRACTRARRQAHLHDVEVEAKGQARQLRGMACQAMLPGALFMSYHTPSLLHTAGDRHAIKHCM